MQIQYKVLGHANYNTTKNRKPPNGFILYASLEEGTKIDILPQEIVEVDCGISFEFASSIKCTVTSFSPLVKEYSCVLLEAPAQISSSRDVSIKVSLKNCGKLVLGLTNNTAIAIALFSEQKSYSFKELS